MKTRRPARITGRAAFTLVEMLVVIAILALLISLIFPGVASSMHSAKMTRCKANLGQIGAAALAYAADHGGEFFPREGIRRSLEEGLSNREVIPYFIKGAGFDDTEVMREYIPDGVQCPFVAPVDIFNQDQSHGRMVYSYSIYAGWQLAMGQRRMKTVHRNMTYGTHEFDIIAADMFIHESGYSMSSHPITDGELKVYGDGSFYRGPSLSGGDGYGVKLNFCRKDGSVFSLPSSHERLKKVPRKFNFSINKSWALLPSVSE